MPKPSRLFQIFQERLAVNPSARFSSPSPGLHHYELESVYEKSRIHLRFEPTGDGLLIINANRIAHLNPTAALMAYLYLEKVPVDQASAWIGSKFRITKSHASNDYAQFTLQLEELIKPDGACPIHDLDLEVCAPFSRVPSAPYRMDLAITYRCNNDCAHCYNGRPRNYPELTTIDWKKIIDGLWQIGIPHIVFTGGEPTLRNDLPELIDYAQNVGLVTGINTNARRLADPNFVETLVRSGLDHVQITVESHDPAVHDHMVHTHGAWRQTIAGLKTALDSSLFVMTNTTMLKDNCETLSETLYFLASLGVPTIGLNALIHSGKGRTVGTGLDEKSLPELLDLARSITEANNQRLIWYTPTQYCNFDPMQLELGVKACTAAMYNMCVEPNGDVIPCQSYYQSVGNLLSDTWDSIWTNPLCLQLRNRQYIPTKCSGCSLLAECGGGCPLQIS